MVLALKNIVWHFLKPLAQIVLSACDYRSFSKDKGPRFSTTVPFSKIQTAFRGGTGVDSGRILRFFSDQESKIWE